MSEDERDIDVELDDGDLGGMDDEGGSLAGDDGIPENKRYIHNPSLPNITVQFSVLWKGDIFAGYLKMTICCCLYFLT